MAKKNKRKRSEIEQKTEELEPTANSSSRKQKSTGAAENASKPNTAPKKSSLDDIDSLFASKKERIKEEKETQADIERREEEKRKFFRKNNESSSGVAVGKAKKMALSGDRSDCAKLKKCEWVDDNRGGIFDSEGFTGRKEEGVKVFKAHLFNKKGFGTTKLCPFDCECCYI